MDSKAVLGLFLPKDTLMWFDVEDWKCTDDGIYITFIEKNSPPQPSGKTKPVFKGYKSITVSDFPIRGKQGVLTFKRRYWKIPGEVGMCTNDIPLVFPGTKIERAFADFLKGEGRNCSDILGEYRDFIPHSSKGV